MSGMSGGMASGWMSMGTPIWLSWVCFVIYIPILLLHLFHLVQMGGQHRAWHTGHVVMALGMAWMFLPTHPLSIPALVWRIVYAGASCLLLVWSIWNWSQRRGVDFLWIPLLIGMLSMLYMYSFPGVANQYLSYILVIYFVLEAIAWFVGVLGRSEKGHRQLVPAILGPRTSSEHRHQLAEGGAFGLRLTLGLMALGMGYMLFAMQSVVH